MNVCRLLVLSVMAIVVQQSVVAAQASKTDSVAKKEYDELNQKISAVTFDSEDAKNALRQIYESYWNGSMNLMDAVRKIKTEISRVVTSKQDLKKMMEKAIEEIKEGSYWDSFLSGARNLVARMAAPFKSGYGYTQDEKETAHEMIKEFEGQKEAVKIEYNNKFKKLNNVLEQNNLTERYDAIISQFNNEIHQQQLITGEAMSTQRKLFWATVATGAAVAGATLLASRGSTEAITIPPVEPQLTSTPEIALEPAPVISSDIVMGQGSEVAPVAIPTTEQIPLITETPQQTIQASEPEISSMPAETIMPEEMPIIEEPMVSNSQETGNEPTQVEPQESNLDELTSTSEILSESTPVVSELEESAPDISTEQELAAPMIEQTSSIAEETPQQMVEVNESDLSSIPVEGPTTEEAPIEKTPITEEVPTAEEMPITEEQVVSEVREETEDKPTQMEPEEGSLDEVSGEIKEENPQEEIGSTEEMVTDIEKPASAEQNVALQEIKNELESYRDKSKVFLNELIAQGGEEGEQAKELLNNLDATYERSLSHYAEEIKKGKDPQEIQGYLHILQANLDKASEDLAQEIQATKEIGVGAETSEEINAQNEQENQPAISEAQELETVEQDSTPEDTPETSVQENTDQENQSKGAEDNKNALENL